LNHVAFGCQTAFELGQLKHCRGAGIGALGVTKKHHHHPPFEVRQAATLTPLISQVKAQGVVCAREVKRLEAGLGRGASAQGTRSNQRTRHERTPCWLGHAHASYK
jgi:hypothetical protein